MNCPLDWASIGWLMFVLSDKKNILILDSSPEGGVYRRVIVTIPKATRHGPAQPEGEYRGKERIERKKKE